MGAFAALTEVLREAGASRLVLKPLPHIYHLGAAEEDLHALHTAGAILAHRDVSSALSPTVRPRPAGARRRAAEHGRETGMVLDEDDDIEAFMELVASVLRERHDTTSTHTPDEMRRLADSFPTDIRLFTARASGELLAGTLVFQTPVVAHTQYIAAAPRGRELSATDALLSYVIENRYPDRRFDFGIPMSLTAPSTKGSRAIRRRSEHARSCSTITSSSWVLSERADARYDAVAVRDREVRSDGKAQNRGASRLGHRERSTNQTQVGKRAGHVRWLGIVDLGRDPLRGQVLRKTLAVRMADAEQMVDAVHAGLG